MPVHKQRAAGRVRDALVSALVQELRQEQDSGQPLILEYRIGDTDAYNVYVVWDSWRDVPPADRSATIREAFRQFEPGSESQIPIAEGWTFAEAIDEGLLPVQVRPLLRKDDPFTREQLFEAMRDEGAIEMPEGPQLRFPSVEAAEQPCRRLNEQFNGIFGIVMKEDAYRTWATEGR